jgi:hypothetical protein
MWNQHAYSITNIENNGSIPKSSEWRQNFKEATLNNFRQNRQGATSADLADIVGSLDPANACAVTNDGKLLFTGNVCNRGARGIGANMPATFYIGEAADGNIVCQTQTDGPVPLGGCKDITCGAPAQDVPPGSRITMVVNDSGLGSRVADECEYENNRAWVDIERCDVVR